MKTTSASPNPELNWVGGQVREVCKEEAVHWINHGVAEDHEKAIVQAPEKAIVGPKEKAVVQAPETAGKQPVVPPAASGNVNNSNAAPTWGTPGVK